MELDLERYKIKLDAILFELERKHRCGVGYVLASFAWRNVGRLVETNHVSVVARRMG